MIDWHDVSNPQPPTPGQVHVWRASCTPSPQALSSFQSCLSPDEMQRAHRFRFERDRHRFIAGRGILRHILAAYLQRPPESLQFTYGKYGKPCLETVSDLHFNLSHSEDWALYAIALTPVGIDLEALRPVPQMDGIIGRYFSEQEKAFLARLTGDAQMDAFFRAWTCKEAYLKAIGQGLTLPLQEIDVELDPDKQLQFHQLPQEHDPLQWPLWGFEPVSHLRAALTVQQDHPHAPQVIYRDWNFS